MSGIAGSRLLIADDQSLIRDAIRRVLRSRKAEFDVASDGEAARKLLDGTKPYDGAVLDQRMPGTSGLELVKRVRAGRSKVPHDLPLMLITGHGEKPVIQAAAKLDIDAVLAKPFTTRTFLERLEHALADRPRRQPPEVYEAVQLPTTGHAGPSNGALAPHVLLSGKPLWVTAAEKADAQSGKATPKQLIPVNRLASGMVLGQSIHARNGRLLAAPGLEMNDRFIARIQALARESEDYAYIEVMARAAAN